MPQKATKTGTCAICGRSGLKVKRGRISRHGYTLWTQGSPGTAACHGSNRAPWEISNEALLSWIDIVQDWVDGLEEVLQDLLHNELVFYTREKTGSRRDRSYFWAKNKAKDQEDFEKRVEDAKRSNRFPRHRFIGSMSRFNEEHGVDWPDDRVHQAKAAAYRDLVLQGDRHEEALKRFRERADNWSPGELQPVT